MINSFKGIWKKKIDVSDNEDEVLNFLHERNIFERGNILSPDKKIWFKFYHFIELRSQYIGKNIYYYVYVTKNEKYEGKILETISFEQLKEALLLDEAR